MKLPSILPRVPSVLLLVLLGSCAPAGYHWSEQVVASATLEADGLHVVANREQSRELPSQGGGEGGSLSRRRVDAWLLDGAKAVVTPGVTVHSYSGGEDQPWRATRTAGHLWSTRTDGFFKDETRVATLAIGAQAYRAGSFGPSPDGGVAWALVREDGTVAIWFEGGSLTEIPELSSPPASSGVVSWSGLAFSSGPRFGLAVSTGASSLALAWTPGSAAARLDGGTPVAFSAHSQGSSSILREYRDDGYTFTDVLFEDAGTREVGRADGPWHDPNQSFRSIAACFAYSFDPSGSVLSLQGHAAGFTLRAGAQVIEIPANGPNDASWCTVLSDGTTIHAAWLERGWIADAPTPHLLHHVIVENGAIRSSQQVDVTTDLIATE